MVDRAPSACPSTARAASARCSCARIVGHQLLQQRCAARAARAMPMARPGIERTCRRGAVGSRRCPRRRCISSWLTSSPPATSSASTMATVSRVSISSSVYCRRRAVLHRRARPARGRRAGSARPSATGRSLRRSPGGRRIADGAARRPGPAAAAWRRCRRPGPRRPAGASCAPPRSSGPRWRTAPAPRRRAADRSEQTSATISPAISVTIWSSRVLGRCRRAP